MFFPLLFFLLIEGHLLALVVTVFLEMGNSTTPGILSRQRRRTGKRVTFFVTKDTMDETMQTSYRKRIRCEI